MDFCRFSFHFVKEQEVGREEVALDEENKRSETKQDQNENAQSKTKPKRLNLSKFIQPPEM